MKTNKMTVLVALACVFLMATCYVVPGASSAGLMKNLNIDRSQWGTVLSVFMFSAMIVQFFIGAVTDRFGHKPIAITGFIALAIAYSLITMATSYPMLIGAALCLGIGAMCLNTVGNTIIPQVLFGGKDPARASNFGNAFFGIGLFVSPLIITYASSYKIGSLMMGGISLAVLFISFFAKYPAANTNYKFSTGFRLLTQPPVFMAALALMCYMGLSNTFNAWLPQIMKEIGASAKQAGLSLSVFGIFVMLGRFMASTFKNLTAWGTKIIGIFAGVLAILIFILSGTHSVIIGLIIAGLAGLAFAPLFPTIVGITFAKYDRKYYGSIFGMIFALGLFFSGVVMKVIGTISSTGTLQSGLLFPVIIAIVMILVSIILGKVKAKPIE